jgi:hypothetical protein
MRPIHTVTASANAIERYSASELDLEKGYAAILSKTLGIRG